MQHSTLDKQSSGKPISDSAAAMCIKDRLYPLMMLLTRTKVKCKVETVNSCTSLLGKGILVRKGIMQNTSFAVTILG